MTKPLCAVLFTLVLGNLCSAQNFQWAGKMSGTEPERVIDMTTDPSGNVISAGWFTGTVDFDPGSGTAILPTTGGAPDGFIQKLDANGNFLWVKRITNVIYDYYEYCDAVKTDAAGNVYVAGRFEGTVDFDPGPGSFQLTSKGLGYDDFFILKLDPAGNFVWAVQRQANNFETTAGNIDLALDANNNIYTVRSSTGSTDFVYMIIEKANSTGTKVWDYKVERDGWGSANITDRHISVDAGGNVIVAGTFGGTLKFNPASSSTWSSFGGDNAYILKINNSGTYTWVRTLGGYGTSFCRDMVTNTAGDIYVAGDFSNMIDFDPGPAMQVDTANSGWLNMYVLKLTPAGNYSWVTQFPGTGFSAVHALAVDAAGNVYAAGDFTQQLTFKTTAPVITKNSGSGDADAFVMKLDGMGSVQWAKQIGGVYTSAADAITVGNGGNVYAGGFFGGTANFDMDGAGFYMSATGSNTFDAFVCKFGLCGNINTSVTQINSNTLTASAGGVSYQWINCAGNAAVSGATSKTFTPTNTGNYAVVITQSGCSDTSTCYSVTGTGIGETMRGNMAMVYPNPNNGVFTIKNISDNDAVVTITNIYGQQVSAMQTKAGNDVHINMSAPAGVYFITVSTAAGKQTEKITIQ